VATTRWETATAMEMGTAMEMEMEMETGIASSMGRRTAQILLVLRRANPCPISR
jgi:hypothetical protein